MSKGSRSASRAKKRPRWSKPADVEKDSTFWHEDGNIVVIVQDAAAYRVHKGVLARRSGVFGALFSLPQPAAADDSAEIMDGCQVVRVHDSARDFKVLLRALYDGIDLFARTADKSKADEEAGAVTFSTLAALARMGHKYDMDHILEAAMCRLRAFFTNRFGTWRAYEAEAYRACPDSPSQVLTPAEIIEAANLFRVCGPREMALIALHLCTKLDMPTLLHGAAHPDGRVETLAADDLERCLVGRERLEARSAEFNHVMLDAKDAEYMPGYALPRCRPQCFEKLNSAWKRLRTAHEHKYDLRRTAISRRCELVALVRQSDDGRPAGVPIMCSPCVRVLLARVLAFQRELWDALPDIMDVQVPNWPPEELE